VRLTLEEETQVWLEGKLVNAELHSPKVTAEVARIARHLPVREVVEQRIRALVRKHEPVIFVGRHLRKAFPEAMILHVTIDPDEARRRRSLSEREASEQLYGRDELDGQTAQRLGLEWHDGGYALDATHLTRDEQAKALLEFIERARSRKGKPPFQDRSRG
jgi:cytidylate kinase